MSVSTVEDRIANLERYCLSLQQQINDMKNNPVVSIGQSFNYDNWCRCLSSEVHKINDAMICATFNKPVTHLQG